MRTTDQQLLKRKDDRVILHFDYDCFYASVVEAENPSLKSKPLAIQQKQIIVTCNYEARRRGLYKLQRIVEAKKLCPDVVIVLGEDLTRFRDASKELYNSLRAYSWNDKVERLGFDEVWLDVTDIIEYNSNNLNQNDSANSFFQTSRADPTVGFSFDASTYTGNTYPDPARSLEPWHAKLELDLLLGSHLALHIRQQLHFQKGYTTTVGISTSRLLSKLVGNMNKPNGQTTLIPPYDTNVMAFMDRHDIGAVPWIGFKLAQKLRGAVLGRDAEFATGLVYGGTREAVTVLMVREMQHLSIDALEKFLDEPGALKGVGTLVFRLIHGIDDSEVAQARNVPRQISIEDSYIRLDTIEPVIKELVSLSSRLLQRMRMDLLATEGVMSEYDQPPWMAKPSTLRLSTRPRPPLAADGTRIRAFNRISRSTPLPSFVFNVSEDLEKLADRLVSEVLLPLFRKLHPERSGWNLSLVNVAATNMLESGGDSRSADGRDIKGMFGRQDRVLDEFRVKSVDVSRPESSQDYSDRIFPHERPHTSPPTTSKPGMTETVKNYGYWADSESDDIEEVDVDSTSCPKCGQMIPDFAHAAHCRFHAFEE